MSTPEAIPVPFPLDDREKFTLRDLQLKRMMVHQKIRQLVAESNYLNSEIDKSIASFALVRNIPQDDSYSFNLESLRFEARDNNPQSGRPTNS